MTSPQPTPLTSASAADKLADARAHLLYVLNDPRACSAELAEAEAAVIGYQAAVDREARASRVLDIEVEPIPYVPTRAGWAAR